MESHPILNIVKFKAYGKKWRTGYYIVDPETFEYLFKDIDTGKWFNADEVTAWTDIINYQRMEV